VAHRCKEVSKPGKAERRYSSQIGSGHLILTGRQSWPRVGGRGGTACKGQSYLVLLSSKGGKNHCYPGRCGRSQRGKVRGGPRNRGSERAWYRRSWLTKEKKGKEKYSSARRGSTWSKQVRVVHVGKRPGWNPLLDNGNVMGACDRKRM